MQSLENERLSVQVSESGALQVRDKQTHTEWLQPTDTLFVRAAGERSTWRAMRVTEVAPTGGGLRITAELADVGGADLGLRWLVSLSGDTVDLTLEETRGLRHGQTLEVAWPDGLVSGTSDETGYLVLPIRTGQLLPFDAATESAVHEDLFYGGLKMPLFGAIKGSGAVAAIVSTPYDCRLRTEANVGGHFSASPVWIIEEGRLNYPRRLRLVFLSEPDHVAIAKAYRREMMSQGRFVSLREKAQASPYVDPLMGAVAGERRTYSLKPEGEPGRPSIRSFFDQAKELGFDRACIWFAGSGARTSSTEEIQREVGYAHSLSPDFRLSLYTNVIDINPTASEYRQEDVLRLRDGTLRPNWFIMQTVCAARRLDRAKRELPKYRDALGPGNVYVDVEGATGLMECYSEEHPMTREQDAGYRRELLRYVKELFGSVTTEHLPHDFLCDVVDVGAYTSIYPYQVFDARTHDSTYRDVDGRDWYVRWSCPFKTIPIPLFQLVWHDSVLSMNSSGKYTESSGWLENYPCEPMHLPLYGLMPDDLSQRSRVMSRIMRKTYYEELVEHRFLTGPTMEYTDRGLYRTRDVQMSRFGDGTVVVVNFSDEPFFYDSHTPVPMHEFAVIQPGSAPVLV